jgi:molybdate transport system ATP-binding protein
LDHVTLRLPSGDLTFVDTTWTWRHGEQWAILGPDGAGKSLLVEALLGNVPAVRGEIRGPTEHDGRRRTGPSVDFAVVSPEVQRQLILSQTSFYQSRWHSGLNEGRSTVAAFLSQNSVEDHNPFEVDGQRGDPHDFNRQRRQVAAWLGIRPLWRRPLAHLSNGELRRTVLAHALLRAPRLLILNDVFAALDPATRARLTDVLGLIMRSGWRVLLLTHRAEEIPPLTTHLLLVHGQRIVAQGRKPDVLRIWRGRFDTHPKSGHKLPPPSKVRRRALGEPIIELKDVTILGHGKRILDRVSWTVRQGECWLVLGPNGAGKTTLLNLIQGDHPQVYSQNVRLFGMSNDSTQSLWQVRQRLGWMSPELHQHYQPDWPVLDVVLSGFANTIGLHAPCSKPQRAAARLQLRAFGLIRQARRSFGELSFGHQRLVLLARSVVKRPALLILDEPCQGLDPSQRRAFLTAVDRAVADTNATLLFVSHHRREVPRCISHVFEISQGRVVSRRTQR